MEEITCRSKAEKPCKQDQDLVVAEALPGSTYRQASTGGTSGQPWALEWGHASTQENNTTPSFSSSQVVIEYHKPLIIRRLSPQLLSSGHDWQSWASAHSNSL